MYPPSLGEGLRAIGIDAITVRELGLSGSSDEDVFSAAASAGYVLLSENVVDFAAIAAERSTAGKHDPGILIALSNRFSRRTGGHKPLIAAIDAHAHETLEDRVIYLQPVQEEP
jgi:hypothetical protein